VPRTKRPVSDTEYTGLTDTATSYSGSTTLDSSVDPGSPLPLVVNSDRNAGIQSANNRFTSGTADLWDDPSSSASLKFSGVSDPPFASASESTPYPNAQQPDSSTSNAFQGLAKFGSGAAILMGNHPQVSAPSPSEVHGTQTRVLTQPRYTSGVSVSLGVIVIVTLIAVLWIGGD
jgi:hypothetical protein